MDSKKIKVYEATPFIDSFKVKNWLIHHHIPFEDINFSQDEAGVTYVLKRNNGIQSVPTILFPDESVLTEPSNTDLEQKTQLLGLFLTQ